MNRPPTLADLDKYENKGREFIVETKSTPKQKRLNLLFAPNLKISISPVADQYRYKVVYNSVVTDEHIATTREKAEEMVRKSLIGAGLAEESIEKLAKAISLDGQIKKVKDIRQSTSVSVYVG